MRGSRVRCGGEAGGGCAVGWGGSTRCGQSLCAE